MIQLYKTTNTNFTVNGDVVLQPTLATITAELNGAWQLNLAHPIDDEGRWSKIAENTVIKVPSFMTDNQLFRVRSVSKVDSGITAICEPVFMDAKNDVFLTDVRTTKKHGQQALDIILAGTKYKGSSNISKVTTAYYEYKNAIAALNGDDDNAFTNRWGGEILFDNYSIIINERIGGDYGVSLLYGKNIPVDGLREDVDMSDVCTRIYPKGYNGVKYNAGGKAYIDSPIINRYPTVFAKEVRYENIKMESDASDDDKENTDITICKNQTELNAALKASANADFALGADKPKITINADMVLLQNTTLYNDYASLETVGLGDTIHCKHNKLGIVTDARVINLQYDCILKRVTGVTLGDFEYNYFNNISDSLNSISNRANGADKHMSNVDSQISDISNRVNDVVRSDGSVIAERLKGVINSDAAYLSAKYKITDKQDVTAMLCENLDASNQMYGAVAIGTQGLQFSKTKVGNSWSWTTAISTGGIAANAITNGVLTGKTNAENNHWNLDTGDVVLSGKFYMSGGKIHITDDDDSLNHITLSSGTSEIMQSARRIAVVQKILNGASELKSNGLVIDYPNATINVGVDFETGENPTICLENNKAGISTAINGNEINISGPNGSAVMQPGRIACYDIDGNITFDSSNL